MDDQQASHLNEQSLNVITQQGTTNSKVLSTDMLGGGAMGDNTSQKHSATTS